MRISQPDDKDVLFFLAECKRRLGSPEGARADYRAIGGGPNHARAIAGRALSHAALGDVPAAQHGLAEALKIDPTLDAQYAKQLKQSTGTFPAAPNNQRKLALLEQLRQSAQQGAEWSALLQLAQHIVQASQYGRLRADEQYQMKLTELRRAVARPKATADDFAALGQFLYEQALIIVGEAVEPHARNRPYRPQSTNAQERELTQAEAAVDRALNMNANHPRALAFKGACRFKRDHDWVTAERFLSRAIDLDGDPVIQDLFAIVLDYIAFVQASAAAELRSVNTWEDTRYIYYRYPSEAELRRADELDAIARRLWAKAQHALEHAIAAAPNSAQSYYYQSILAERNKNLPQAVQQLKKAVELDPAYFEAAQRLSTIAHKIGQTHLAYTAQSIATNLVQTSAAPMLKLSWIEFSRTAYQSATKALAIAANLDPSDPRVAAYQGAVARENGDHALAESWFMAAAALEEVRLSLLGINVRETTEMRYQPHDIARLLAINNAAATELNQRSRFQQTTALLEINSAIYRQTSQESQYTKSPYGLLPELFEDPSRIPEAPTIEALMIWSTVHAAKANVGQQRYDEAMKQFEWASDFESRKPPTMDQGMVVRVPGMWARLGMVDIEIRKRNGRAASERMQFYGHPSIATPTMKAEADRLRNAIEDLGFRSGGQTLHDMRDQQRRNFQRNQR
ncbi:MAG: tetratricopeptide repeat protein [Nitrospirales bacterium]|nr:tetratricopeptide repeat protein [Nitrospirales bacterium]